MKKERILLSILALLLVFILCEIFLRPKELKSSLAEQLYRRGAYEKAGRLYEKIGEDSLALANLGKAEYRQDEHAAAQNSLDKARSLSEDSSQIDYDAGNAAYQQERYQEAAQNYIRALLKNPDDEDLKANLELALRKLQAQPPPPRKDEDENEDKQRKEEELRMRLEALDNKEVQDRKPSQPQAPSRSQNWW